MFHFEHRAEPLISRAEFLKRLARSFGVVILIIGVALGLGMIGYHWLENMPWIDSFLNASMILGGMGPVDPMKTDAGKLFAGCYALFSGLAFLALAGLMFGPLAHRLLHRFHYEADQENSDS
ncbi:MAG: hypothetical protein QM680_03155 [Luteolibacter sp.]